MRQHVRLFLVLSIAAAIGCTSTAAGDGSAASPSPGPTVPPAADDGAPDGSRSAEQVCGDMDPVVTPPGTACTEIGCTSGLHLSVLPLASWPHGEYRYVLDVDGRTVTCEGSLPLRGCEPRSITCSEPGFAVVESGCALSPADHAFGGMEIPGFPDRVHLRIELDGRPLADEDLDLRWTRTQPNGEGCPPVCCQASDEVTLNF